MAGDWVKMRVWLRRDPRVASMADYLATSREFMDHITDPVHRSCDHSVYEHITRDVTRAITVCALLEIWGVARERGNRDGDDLVLKHCDLGNLDAICSIPGIGEALEYVEWASCEVAQDKKGRSVSCVRFPNFFAENESPEDRYKKQHAEAQARYRAKKAAESDGSVEAKGDITRDITVTPREEKRREEEKEPNGSVAKGDRLPGCPHDQIVSLYHEALPSLPAVRLMTEARKRALKTFWGWVLTSKKSDGSPRAVTADQALTWIRGYFERASQNDFLMGREGRSGGHSNWQCDLDFLLTEKGKRHVIEKTREAA